MGQQYPGHVALSTGDNNIMSLWQLPNNNWALQATTVDAMVEGMGGPVAVTVGNAPWNE